MTEEILRTPGSGCSAGKLVLASGVHRGHDVPVVYSFWQTGVPGSRTLCSRGNGPSLAEVVPNGSSLTRSGRKLSSSGGSLDPDGATLETRRSMTRCRPAERIAWRSFCYETLIGVRHVNGVTSPDALIGLPISLGSKLHCTLVSRLSVGNRTQDDVERPCLARRGRGMR